jgi:hypothetical protein
LNRADLDFFTALGGETKEALDEQSIAALNVKQPELLDQLEEQASAQVPDDQEEQAPEEQVPEEQVDVKSEEEDVRLQVPKSFFRTKGIHPLKLLVVLKLRYKDDWVEWLPDTLWEAIRRDFGPISEVNQNKIQALAVSLSTNAAWQDWPIFENCGKAFNDAIPVFGQVQPLSPVETVFTVSLLKKLQDFAFSQEVLGYIASVCLYNGIIYAPVKWFGKVQWIIDKQNENPDLVGEIKQAWETVKKQDLQHVEFNDVKPVDVHIAKLWAIREYLGDKDSQLKEA